MCILSIIFYLEIPKPDRLINLSKAERLDFIKVVESPFFHLGEGYAKRHGMKFLTGDKEFEDLPDVEFVK